MYSYGSSSRVATGKGGHGGRNYRAPPERKDPNSTPPPMKQCDCLVELDIPEYAAPQQEGRTHVAFGGRESMQAATKIMRSMYCCHLEVPGRNKGGPVGIVAQTLHKAIPACYYLIQQLALAENMHHIQVRIHKNVKQTAQGPIEGILYKVDGKLGCLFDSASSNVSIGACAIASPEDLQSLNTCLDNLQFQAENRNRFEILSCPTQTVVFAIGTNEQIRMLLEEIKQTVAATT